MDCVRQVLPDGPDVGLAHIGRHSDDLGPGTAQPPPERLQSLDTFAIADEHDRAGD